MAGDELARDGMAKDAEPVGSQKDASEAPDAQDLPGEDLKSGAEQGEAEGGAAWQADLERLEQTVALLRDEVERWRKQAVDWQNQYLQLQTDFRRYRQRMQDEATRLRERVTGDVIGRLLPVLDDLERAAEAAREHDITKAREALVQGVDMVRANFYQALQQFGLAPVETQATRFDPSVHEAVGFEITRELPDGYILRETRRGYRLGEHVLRPAQVIVAKSPESTDGGQESPGEPAQPAGD
ncbi:MAG: nucleotide exchange factor GrpE [Limnochordales bacterium]|nr:nucleotide exchange factor GrpE [Limnochordales bacterium]